MTTVDFHSGVADKLDYTCRLLRKAWRAGSRVLVTGEPAQLARLDALLWTFEPGEFIPHARLRAGQAIAPLLARTPIWLADSPDSLPAQAGLREVLVNIGPDLADGYQDFGRVIEIVAASETEVANGRQRWRQYLAAGLKPSNLKAVQATPAAP